MTRECLHCGESEAVVRAVRQRDGYTLGCGIESNTQGGFDYEELSPTHRWADWSDKDLASFGIKPEAFEKHRRTSSTTMRWIACDDTVRGHVIVENDEPDWGMRAGVCMACGKYPNQSNGSES